MGSGGNPNGALMLTAGPIGIALTEDLHPGVDTHKTSSRAAHRTAGECRFDVEADAQLAARSIVLGCGISSILPTPISKAYALSRRSSAAGQTDVNLGHFRHE